MKDINTVGKKITRNSPTAAIYKFSFVSEQSIAKVLLSNICTVNKGGIVLKILCWLTIMGHMIISYNIPETYMLYLCFKAIKAQTEKSRESIGQENYNRRKR